MMVTRHVYPVNDTYEHDTEDDECWCRPNYEHINGHWLVTHNPADGRELNERVLH